MASVSEDDEEAPPVFRRRRLCGPAHQSLILVRRSRSRVVEDDDDDESNPIEDVESDSQGSEDEEDDGFEGDAEEDSKHYGKGDDGEEAEGKSKQQHTDSSPQGTPNVTAALPVFNKVVVGLRNHDVLHCPICSCLLFIPAFQCENGHITCSSCRLKLKRRCHFCYKPIGINNNPCWWFEKFIKSVSRISCKNFRYGCKKKIPYGKKSEHEQMCPLARCFCPYPSCHFARSSTELYLHFAIQHAASITPFTYNTILSISIEKNQKHIYLQEQQEGVIFILNHQVQEQGQRALNIDCLGLGTLKGCFVYQLTAKSMETSLSFQSVPETHTMWSDDAPVKNYLTVPSRFVDNSTGLLSLSLCIKKVIEVEAEDVWEEFGNRDSVYEDEEVYAYEGEEVLVVMSKTDILYCSICLEPLWIRVFQCEKEGHIVCPLCCSKLKEKCGCCGCMYKKCYDFDYMIGSINMPCKYASLGCKSRMGSEHKNAHEKDCLYSPCCSPPLSRLFTGSYNNL